VSPDERLVHRLAREIESELSDLERLSSELETTPRTNDSVSLRARGSILHDFFTGAERIFIRIADELDGGTPKGDHWHTQLLRNMSLDLPEIRPAVITHKLMASLGEYLRFRHVFRNNYGFVLEPERIKPLEQNMPSVLEELGLQLRDFLSWLRGGEQ